MEPPSEAVFLERAPTSKPRSISIKDPITCIALGSLLLISAIALTLFPPALLGVAGLIVVQALLFSTAGCFLLGSLPLFYFVYQNSTANHAGQQILDNWPPSKKD